MKQAILILFLGFVVPVTARADLSLPTFFSDSMVLQRGEGAAIWGTAASNAEVSISFKGKVAKANADSQGHWKVSVETGPADATGAELVITSGNDRVTIKDVLVGEVWLASGQSNMVFTMNRVPAYEQVISESNHPAIRMFNAPTVTSVEPQFDIDGQWTACSPETVPGYSAVAFFFARKLHQELGVPIGVIKTAWGGKPVETFTSREALETLEGTKTLVQQALSDDANYDADRANLAYQMRLKQWEAAAAQWREKPADQRGRLARKPAPPKRPLDTEGKPGVLFNSMIHPFIGYTIRGAIWYQGEGNAKPGAVPYDLTLPLMIQDWRNRWNDDFSFYFVQLANFRDPTSEPGVADPWPLLQDRMRRILATTPKTGMAIINDVGEAKDIHPKNKHDPGERLALWALAKDYGQELVYSGPLYQSSKVDESAIRVTFEQAGDGLKSRDGESLKRFEIAGKDRVWHWAEAEIESPSTVVVSSENVSAPIAVRYAWASNPEGANLVNSEGLPASVFRTDDWDDVEQEAEPVVSKDVAARRTLADQIKAINAKRESLDRTSAEYQALTKQRQALMKRFRELAPANETK